MKVTIVMRGTLRKVYGEEERIVEVPEGTTCEQALESIGIFYKEEPKFGFVSVNNMRCMIYDELHDGDYLKAFSKVYGG